MEISFPTSHVDDTRAIRQKAGDSLNAAMAATVALYEATRMAARAMSARDRIAELQDEAVAAIGAAGDAQGLERLRIEYLGRKAELPQLLRTIPLEPAERAAVGAAGNAARNQIERALELQEADLAAGEIAADAIDVSLPGAPSLPVGHLHLITQTRRDIEDVFLRPRLRGRRRSRGLRCARGRGLPGCGFAPAASRGPR